MRRAIVTAALMSISIFVVGADPSGSKAVFVIRGAETPAQDPWTLNVLPAEAARLFVPSDFRKKGPGVEIATSAKASFSIGPARELERSKDKVLLRFDVVVRGAPRLPRADKTVTMRFSLADVIASGGASGGAYARSPGLYAISKAISAGPYASGSAWLKSIDYDGAGRFVASVALRKAR